MAESSNTNSLSFNSTENQNSIGLNGVLKKRQRKQDKTRKLTSIV